MYRADLINAAMGARRMTNEKLAAATGLGTVTVSAIRNGKENIELPSLLKVAEALGLDMRGLFTPEPEQGKGVAVSLPPPCFSSS